MLRLLRSRKFLTVAGLALWQLYRNRQKAPAGFARSEATPDAHPIRNAGPDAMRDRPGQWDEVDERSDESFPASDATAKY
jgi:cytochrome oxidase assembly protein ShyY1